MEIIKNGFKNNRLGIELDVYIIEEKEWFKAKDISDFLGYSEAKDMTRIISFEENINRHIVPNVVNPKGTLFINEFGLYEIICKINKTDSTRFNKAREFQKWVFSEVLPSIRKNNYYVDKENITDKQKEQIISNYSNILLHNKKKSQRLHTFLEQAFPDIEDVYSQFLKKMQESDMLDKDFKPTEKFVEHNNKVKMFTHSVNTSTDIDVFFTLTNNGMDELCKRLYVENRKLCIRKRDGSKELKLF